MRHLFLVEVDADDSISAETVQMMYAVSTRRAHAEECKAEDRHEENFAYFARLHQPVVPRTPDMRDLNIGPIKIVCSFTPRKTDSVIVP